MLGKERFAGVDIRVRVKGGGRVAQIYGKAGVIIFLNDLLVPSYLSIFKKCDDFLTFNVVVFQLSVRPSPNPWLPTTRSVSITLIAVMVSTKSSVETHFFCFIFYFTEHFISGWHISICVNMLCKKSGPL